VSGQRDALPSLSVVTTCVLGSPVRTEDTIDSHMQMPDHAHILIKISYVHVSDSMRFLHDEVQEESRNSS